MLIMRSNAQLLQQIYKPSRNGEQIMNNHAARCLCCRGRFARTLSTPAASHLSWEQLAVGAGMRALRADIQHACSWRYSRCFARTLSTQTSWEQIVVGTFLHALRADIQHACSWRYSRRALRADSVRSAVDGWLRACCLMFTLA